MAWRSTGGIHISVERDQRRISQSRDVSDTDHFTGPDHHAVLHRTLIKASVYVPAQAELRFKCQVEPPIVEPIGKARTLANTQRIKVPVRPSRTQRLIDIGVPGAFRKRCRTLESSAISSHVTEQSRR